MRLASHGQPVNPLSVLARMMGAMTRVTRTHRHSAAVPTQASDHFWQSLQYVQENWSRADMQTVTGYFADKPALANILWTVQKLAAASNRGDAGAVESNIADMRRRISEGVRNGWLSASDAAALRRIAAAFRPGGALNQKGAVPQLASLVDTVRRYHYDLSPADMSAQMRRLEKSPEYEALPKDVKSELSNALWDAYKVATRFPFSTNEAKEHLAQLKTRLRTLEGMAGKGHISRESLSALEAFVKEYEGTIKRQELNAPAARASAQAERQKLYDDARGVQARLQAIDDYYRKVNGGLHSGGYLAGAVYSARRALPELTAALNLPDSDPTKPNQVRLAMERGLDALKSFPRGKDPVAHLAEEREYNLKMLGKVGDVAGAIPGPWGKILGFTFKGLEAGLRYADGEITGTDALNRAFVAGIDSALGSKITGGSTSSVLANGIRTAAWEYAKSFEQDVVTILTNDKLTPEEKGKAIERAAKGAAMKAYLSAVAAQLGRTTDAISDEDKRELINLVKDFGTKMGWDAALVDTAVDKIKSVPSRFDQPASGAR